jgi:hypothetical protein
MNCTKHAENRFMVLYNHMYHGMENCPVCKMEKESEEIKEEVEKLMAENSWLLQLIADNGFDVSECRGCHITIIEQSAYEAPNGDLFCTDGCAQEYEKAIEEKIWRYINKGNSE